MDDKDKTIEQQNQAIAILNNRLESAEAEKRKLEQEINRLNLMAEFKDSEIAEWKQKFSNLTQEMKGK
jgi:chromosome segregation ATPase